MCLCSRKKNKEAKNKKQKKKILNATCRPVDLQPACLVLFGIGNGYYLLVSGVESYTKRISLFHQTRTTQFNGSIGAQQYTL
jgi:hypothetical protein